MGTGGAYKFAFQNESESAIVLNGDILTDVDVAKIVSRHVESSADATIALTPVPDPSRYGLVETAADGRISRFLEKPDAAEVENLGTNLINAGIYILEPSMLKMVKGVENASFEYEVFPKALDSGLHLNSFSLNDSYWRDIGTPESYIEAHMDLLGGKIPGFKIDRSKTDPVDYEAVDAKSIIAEECVIKPTATIVNSILGPGVHVEDKAIVKDSIIWSHTRVSPFAQIDGAIICRSCHIGRNAVVGPGSVLGDKASIPDHSKT
jgi:NDP-sugar pyrophosphorylase family protein